MTRRLSLACLMVASAHLCLAAEPPAKRFFLIEVVDARTGRGVPLVELRTVNGIRHYTDSAGLVAFHEPGLMNREVYFHVASHGYEHAADGFGFRGKRLTTRPGGSARLRIRRKNIAERLYRVTGQGIYRDTVLAGRKPPIRRPVLNGRVLGQDSTQAVVYRGRIHWFWGDTSRESYPLGQFSMSGATSELPSKGGLDPNVGVDLEYFVDKDGFSRKMCPLPEHGMVWLDGLMTLKDKTGRRRLLAHYSLMKSLGERLQHGLAVYNDEKAVFERRMQWAPDVRLEPAYQALRATVGGVDYCYFTPSAYPFVRVKADWDAVIDPTRYEAFTPLAAGSAFDKDSPKLDRDGEGKLIWGWKRNTAHVDAGRQQALIAGGHIKADEAWIDLRDVQTGKPVAAHRGSVRWNDYRRRWVMILGQTWGKISFLGEIFYAEADRLEGPWRRARKIVTHDKYTFYNPVHHGFLDQHGGRVIYFEGTYTHTFSATKTPTPRYDYNQIMYRLDLSDPRLKLPKPSSTP